MSFVQFGAEDSVISSEIITGPLWTGGSYNLTSSYVDSYQQNYLESGKFYMNVYNQYYPSNGSEVQFSISYGHISGSGSAFFNGSVDGRTPTRDVYGQLRNLVYGDEGSVFNFGGTNGVARDVFAISIARSRYKEAMNAGTWNIILGNGTNSITLTDNSKDSSITTFLAGNRVYNIVSGSYGNSYNNSATQTNSGSYGMFFPDMGLLVLNPRALSLTYASGGLGLSIDETAGGSYSNNFVLNNRTLYNSIASGSSFEGRSQETISARYFFVNAKSGQLNYTTNPSIIDSNGNILYSTLVDNPKTYPTTIGLYNDAGELLAVAKLSKPLPKDFTKQITCRVKLEF